MYHPFSVAETLQTSWNILKKNFVTIIVFSTIAVFIIALVSTAWTVFGSQQNFATQIAISVLIMFINAYTTLGLYKLIFTLIDSEYYEFEFSQIIPTVRMVLSYLSIYLLLALVVAALNIFLTGPGGVLANYPLFDNIFQTVELIVALYLALRWMFFICFIVDDNSGPFESLSQSFFVTKDNILKILALLGIIIVFIAIPFFFALEVSGIFGVTLIITYPFVNIILIVAYRKLVYSHQDVDDDISETL